MKAIIKQSIVLATMIAITPGLRGGDKNSSPKIEGKVVDSGSFGIYVGGKRIGTETFKIEQRSDFHVATAVVTVDDGTVKAVQNAELQITPQGDLHSYVWHATSPAKEEATVEPGDQVMIEHLMPADLKKSDVPHALPPETAILDDNFFSQREVLLWRYLARGCSRNQDGSLASCGNMAFIALVPRQHISLGVNVSLIGPDKINMGGVTRILTKIAMKMGDPKQMVIMNGEKESNSGEWFLWVDYQTYKIIKIAVPDSNVEVIRD